VSDGKSTITGPVLTLRPQEQRAEVPGGGTMVLAPEPKPDKPAPEPVHVAWTGHASLDGKTNLVDLHEGIAFKTIDAEGMTTTSKASHLQIVLADKPATQPTTDAATQPATQPTTRPAEGLAALQNMDFLANKDPRSAKLTGGVEVESTLLNTEGGILRRMYMKSEEAAYDMETRRMVVPLPGQLLYEDHRPPEAKKDEDAGPANRGTTAFAWKRQLTYDDAADRAVMDGDVEINHVPDDQNGQSFGISTQRVTAEMEPKPATAPATLPATKPATQPNALAARMRLKQVIADGGVSVRTKRFQFTATRVTYSPTTGILTARGAPGEPITLTDEQGQVDSAIESLTWNTKTDQVSLKGGRGRVRP
jgi:lipopolysaccharide export system protein LptA